MNATKNEPVIAILGAGPIGLEAALAATARGLPFTVYEKAPSVAHNVRSWGHVRLFTPWELNVSPRVAEALAALDRTPPTGPDCPRGDELVAEVLDPIAETPAIGAGLALDTEVLAVGREGLLKHEEIASDERATRPFRLLVEERGGRRIDHADVVLDCTGTWDRPNALGDGGIPAPGEAENDGCVVRSLPDLSTEADAWAGRTVLLVGAGHSAQTAARDLAELAAIHPQTRIVWALKSENPGWGRVPDDPLPAREELCATAEEIAAGASPHLETRRGVVVERLQRRDGRTAVTLRPTDPSIDGASEEIEVDRVLSLVGSVGDHALYRQLQVHECYATCGPMNLAAALMGEDSDDCLAQSSHGVEALRSPEPNFYILGEKSYGRNNTFLMRTGWQQVDEVFGAL